MQQAYKGFNLGILGGGQLGRMLIQSCVDFNIRSLVLDPDAEAPCSGICDEFTRGSFNDHDTVMAFGEKADIITIEIEHVNVDALTQLKNQGKAVYPQPEVIRLIQDKGLQKQFYQNNNIPTAPFVLLKDESEIKDHLSFLPAFQKSRTAGYDGKGVKGIFTEADIKDALPGPGLLEKKVDYQMEIAVVVARSRAGEVKAYPLVELVFHPEKNLLDYLASPARIAEDIADKAQGIARDVAEKLGIIGLLAVEMFVTHAGEVLVNEVAPRPHNSGHQTIEANITSQYEQHLRAICGLPLGATDAIRPSVMINLLGEPGYEGEAVYQGMETVMGLPGVHVHLYGKAITKPYRKMGHVTITGNNWEEVKSKAASVQGALKIIA